jgi:predicted methyltransferase
MTRRREVPAQVAKRLHAAGFKNVQAQGDGLLAQLR